MDLGYTILSLYNADMVGRRVRYNIREIHVQELERFCRDKCMDNEQKMTLIDILQLKSMTAFVASMLHVEFGERLRNAFFPLHHQKSGQCFWCLGFSLIIQYLLIWHYLSGTLLRGFVKVSDLVGNTPCSQEGGSRFVFH